MGNPREALILAMANVRTTTTFEMGDPQGASTGCNSVEAHSCVNTIAPPVHKTNGATTPHGALAGSYSAKDPYSISTATVASTIQIPSAEVEEKGWGTGRGGEEERGRRKKRTHNLGENIVTGVTGVGNRTHEDVGWEVAEVGLSIAGRDRALVTSSTTNHPYAISRLSGARGSFESPLLKQQPNDGGSSQAVNLPRCFKNELEEGCTKRRRLRGKQKTAELGNFIPWTPAAAGDEAVDKDGVKVAAAAAGAADERDKPLPKGVPRVFGKGHPYEGGQEQAQLVAVRPAPKTRRHSTRE